MLTSTSSVGIGGIAVVLPKQSVAAEKDGVDVNQRKQMLKKQLTQSMHYSEKVRKGSFCPLFYRVADARHGSCRKAFSLHYGL